MPLTDAEIKKAKHSREDGKSERLTDGGGMYLDLLKIIKLRYYKSFALLYRLELLQSHPTSNERTQARVSRLPYSFL